jgi:hypothetical protein
MPEAILLITSAAYVPPKASTVLASEPKITLKAIAAPLAVLIAS